MADVKELKGSPQSRPVEGGDEIETFLAPSAADIEKRRAASGGGDGIDVVRVRVAVGSGGPSIHISQPGPVGISPSRGGGSGPDQQLINTILFIRGGALLALQHGRRSDIDLEARRTVDGTESHAYMARLFGKNTAFVEEQLRGIQSATIANSGRKLTPLGALLVLGATRVAKNPAIRAGIDRAMAENRGELRKSGLSPTEITGLQRAAARQATESAKGWEKDARRIQTEIVKEAAGSSAEGGAAGFAPAKAERQRGDAFAISGGESSAEAEHHRQLVEEASALASADRKAAANRQAEGRARAGSNPNLARGAVRLSDLG